ncbi:MAG: exodeoxyribonuclease VII large subunit [Armatimonadota bacterium]|nr:exodeoxyribonuclease VII large subunit [Armatimonadota bacterium]
MDGRQEGRTFESVQGESSAGSIHTPSSLLLALEASLRISRYATPVLLKGVWRPGSGREYNGFCYDRLEDEYVPGRQISIRIPVSLRGALREGQTAVLKGVLRVQAQDSGEGLRLVFHVAELMGVERPALSEQDLARAEILRARAARESRDLDGLLASAFYRGEKPRVVLLTGLESVVDRDILAALGSAAEACRLEWRRASLGSAAEVAAALARAVDDAPPVLAVVRGGGSGLEVFEDPAVARAALQLPCVLVTAIGHTPDVTLLDMVADRQFETPTRLGQHLREVWERTSAKTVASVAAALAEADTLRP